MSRQANTSFQALQNRHVEDLKNSNTVLAETRVIDQDSKETQPKVFVHVTVTTFIIYSFVSFSCLLDVKCKYWLCSCVGRCSYGDKNNNILLTVGCITLAG